MYQGSLGGDHTTTNSFYPHQFHQPPFQNPNPNPNPVPIVDPYVNSWPSAAASASAPPLTSSYAPSSDFSNYYPPFAHNSDHAFNSAPTAPSFPPNPNPQFPPPSNIPYDHNQPSYYPYDHNQAAPNPNLSSNASFPGPQYSSYDDSGVKFDRWGGQGEQDHSMYSSQGYDDDGAYRYEGGKVEPYGARGTAGFSGSNSQVMFDDYGRPINLSNGGDGGMRNGGDQGRAKAVPKVVKAAPKEDTEEDFNGGVQKFRVKLLAESYGQNELDVLCQIGLDGIRMLDPATGRTLRIYHLETITRWEVLDSYIFAFWAKLPVDIEPKRIRLKSNRYTTNTILDIVTAASVQLKEIGERKDSSSAKASEQLAEKKKGFVDWVNLIKPPNEEKDHWVPDEAVNKCSSCSTNFNAFNRKHHCRNCGEIFCDKCTQGRTPLTADEDAPPVRVCDRCMVMTDPDVPGPSDPTLACQGDLAVSLCAWAHNLLPMLNSKSTNNPLCRDLILQLIERILAAPKARTILVNGAVRKGERLIPPVELEILIRATFPMSSARVKATERFEAVYPILKEVALAGAPGSKAMKQVSQQIFGFTILAAGEGIAILQEYILEDLEKARVTVIQKACL